MFKFFYYLLIAFFLVSCESDPYDLVIQNGIIYDGSGSDSESVDIGIIGNQIIKVGKINSKNSLKIIKPEASIIF